MFRNREFLTRIAEATLPPHHHPNIAFIDADNVWRTFESKLSSFGIANDELEHFEFSRLFKLIPHDRCFVYCAIRDEGPKPFWLEQLEHTDGFILKTGRLVRRKNELKQEGVDVKLAIDATRFAFSNIIKTCTLYGADGDFIPLVEAITESGTLVNVASFNDPEQGEVAPRLRAASDRYIRMNRFWLYETLSEKRSTVHSRPNLIHSWLSSEEIYSDRFGDEEYEIRKIGSEYAVCLDAKRPLNLFTSSEIDDLRLWLKLAPFKENIFNHHLLN
ncbi:NYN domain-containing protein [uncultured Roseobacter sp.]|uniref:NYN domain-containing protein n=1 Tax=uncultured Roseobacter sp. TaxID=114847 RepID=UPI00261D7D5F|nr:NYN domain-containing protein [uncultured Roseobacter sp.]